MPKEVRVKLRYSEGEVTALGHLLAQCAKDMLLVRDSTVALKAVALKKLAERLIDRINKMDSTSQFILAHDEALAFHSSYDDGHIASNNAYTVAALNRTYSAISKVYGLEEDSLMLKTSFTQCASLR